MKTFESAAYPYSLGFLVVAVLARFKIGTLYAILAFADPNEIPFWQKVIDIVFLTWLVLINVVIQSKVHSIRWYKTIACTVFLWPFALGWGKFLEYVFMDVLP